MDINILDLTLDALVKVCKHLNRFNDKMNFAKTHPKLWKAFVYENRNKVRSVFCARAIPLIRYHWEFTLEWWGPSITTIYSRPELVDLGKFMESVAKFCPNLRKILIDITKEGDIEKLEAHLPKLQMLKVISISDWIDDRMPIKQSFNAKLFVILQGLRKLRTLHFNFKSLDNKDKQQLNKLIQLRELDAYTIQPDDFNDISTLLGRLCVFQTYNADCDKLFRLSEHCANLEQLILTDSSILDEFPYFSKLKQIRFCKRKGLTYFSCQFDSRYQSQLKVLDARELVVKEDEFKSIGKLRVLEQLAVNNISQSYMLQLISLLSSLKKLTCRCYDIDEQFLPKLLTIFKGKNSLYYRSLRLNILCTLKQELMLKPQLEAMPKYSRLNLTVFFYRF